MAKIAEVLEVVAAQFSAVPQVLSLTEGRTLLASFLHAVPQVNSLTEWWTIPARLLCEVPQVLSLTEWTTFLACLWRLCHKLISFLYFHAVFHHG